MQKLTAKEWVHQKINYYTIEDIIPTGPEETYCKELSSILRPGIPQTFGTLQKWEDFDAEVLKLYEGLDNTQRDYNKLFLHAIDPDTPRRKKIIAASAPKMEWSVRAFLFVRLQAISQLAACLGCNVLYTGGRCTSFTDLIIKIMERSSSEDLTRLIMAVLEVRADWQWPIPHDMHLVDALQDPKYTGRVTDVVQQVFADAVLNECPYMIISTVHVAYFLRRNLTDPSDKTIWVSPPVPLHIKPDHYPPMAAWLYLLFLADQQMQPDGTKRPRWPQQMVSGLDSHNYQLVLNGRQVLLGYVAAAAAAAAGGTADATAIPEPVVDSGAATSNSSSSSTPGSIETAAAAKERSSKGFDGTAWAQSFRNFKQQGLDDNAATVAAVNALPFLPTSEYKCSAHLLVWGGTKAVYKGLVAGQHEALFKIYSARDEKSVKEFVTEAVAFVELAAEHGKSIIPLAGLGRQMHTGNPMLVFAAGEELRGKISPEVEQSADDALCRLHAAGRLHGAVYEGCLLLYKGRVVLWDLEFSTVSSDEAAQDKERWRLGHVFGSGS